MINIRMMAPAILAAVLSVATTAASADTETLRVGALKFGTVNWELNTITHNGLDAENGVSLEIVELAGKNASAVALQGGAADVIVSDWIWVSRQRAAGADYTFVPYSLTVGALMVHPDSGIETLADLEGRKLGIAGGPVDKSWLLLRAYGQQELGLDLADIVEPVFGAPPLLNELMLSGEVPAVLNFWHYNARLGAAGMTELVSVVDMLPALGVDGQPPLLGWVFSESWAAENASVIDGMLTASRAAKELLSESDAEWERLRPMTRAADDTTLTALRDAWRSGVPVSFGPEDIDAAEKVFSVMAELGGEDLTGGTRELAPGTFWPHFGF